MEKNQKRVINYQQLVINAVNNQNKFLSEISLYGHLFFDIRDKKYCFYYHGQNFPVIATQSKKEIANFLTREFRAKINSLFNYPYNIIEIELILNLSSLNKKLRQEFHLSIFKLYILENSINALVNEVFNFTVPLRFILKEGILNYYINNFIPTEFLKLKFIPKFESKYDIDFKTYYYLNHENLLKKMYPDLDLGGMDILDGDTDALKREVEKKSLSFIEKFILYLVKEDYYTFYYTMNWISCYFNTLNKSSTTLVLLNNKEVTKDIFWNKIIKKIFGLRYCITINDTECKSNSLFDIAKEKIFFHIEDIKNANTIFDDNTMSIIVKDLLVKSSITKLNKQREEETIIIYGQTLITSDNPYPYIKRSMSKCTIIETNDMETILNKLYIQDEAMLEDMIEQNLYNFAQILRNFSFSHDYAKYALDNSARQYVLSSNKSNVNLGDIEEHLNSFIQAIKNKDISFFVKLKSLEDTFIYVHLVNAFEDGYFIGQDLYEYYNVIYPNEFSSKKQLMAKLKHKDNMFGQMTDTFRISKPDGSDEKILFSAYQTNVNKGSKKLYKIEGYKLPSDMIIKKGYVISSSQRKDENIFDKYTYEDNKEDAIKLRDKYDNK